MEGPYKGERGMNPRGKDMSGMETGGNEANQRSARGCGGFSVIELVVVITVLLIVGAIALPRFMSMIHSSRLRGAVSDFNGIIQADRIRAVQDGKFYSVIFAGKQAFVDVNGNGQLDTGEPSIAFSSEVTAVAAAAAPATVNLQAQFLPVGSAPNLNDGGPTSGTPITFSSRGLPCKTQNAVSAGSAGIVCDSAGGATAFWVFFRNTITGEFEAVTVTPAGRIRLWRYGGQAWGSV